MRNPASPVLYQALNGVPALRRNGGSPEISFDSTSGWETEIKRLWAQHRSNMMELGRAVYAAKRKLLYGQWTHFLKSRRIPIAKRTAEMLVVIAKRLRKLDAHIYAHLPSALNTLYQLAQLEHAVLVSLIAEGTIHAGLTMSEAKELVAKHKPQRNGRRRLQVKSRLSKFREFLLRTLPDWTAAERALVQSKLQDLLEQISCPIKSSIPN